MKKLIFALILCLATGLQLQSVPTTYYLDNTNGAASNSNTGTNPALPWMTFAKATSTLAPGDTLIVGTGGSYNVRVTETTDGTVGARITYIAAAGSPRPKVMSFSLTGADYVTVSGFEITSSGLTTDNVAAVNLSGTHTGDIVTNNYIHDIEGTGTSSAGICISPGGGSFDQITLNTIDYCGITAYAGGGGQGIHNNSSQPSSDMLIEGNTISHVSDYTNPYGARWVIRNNIFGPCTPATAYHVDGMQNDAIASDSLFEGNLSTSNNSSNNHLWLNQVNGADGWIVRYNSTNNTSRGGMDLRFADHINFYNNTLYDSIGAGNPETFWWLFNNTTISNIARNNIWYHASPQNPYGVAVGSAVDKDYDLWYLNGDPIETNDVPNTDPLLVDGPGGNFNLTASSPARDAGGPLTTVAAADIGSGTSLILTSAYPFQPGWAGTNPDHISVGTVGNTATISTIDYASGTVTLTGGITRNDGDPVWLYSKSDGVVVLSGTAPDIGAFEYSATVPTLTSITPSYGNLNATTSISLAGTALDGATPSITVSGTGVTVSNLVQVSAILVTADFAVASGAITGARNVTLTTAGGTSNAVTFTIEPLALTTVAPSGGNRNTTVPVTLTGTAFDLAGGATVNVSGTGVTQSALTVVNHTTITLNFIIAVGATISTRTVSVTTANGTSNTGTFDVLAATNPALLVGVSPAFGYQGATVNFTLTGDNLDTGNAAVTISGTGVTASGITVVGPTAITGQFNITGSAATTPRSVTVTTDTGTSNPVTFSVFGLGSAGRGKLIGRGGH